MDVSDKYVQMGVKAGVVAISLLAVFLLSKTISEVVSWGKDGIYPTRTVTVMAEGEAIATADIASFSFSVSEEGTTSEDAQGKVSTKIDQALKYLKDNGVEDKDIKTEYYNINPKYENVAPCYAFDCPVAVPKIVGYEVSQGIKVKVRDTDNAGKFLSEMTKFGINNVSGLAFTIDDEDVLYDAARKDAVEKAEAKGNQLAKDLGVRLGKVVSFSEDNGGMYPTEMGYGGDMKSAVAPQARDVSLPQGENIYTTRVYVTYELK